MTNKIELIEEPPPAVIAAVYASWRPNQERGVLQMIFEVPIQAQRDVMNVLGAPTSFGSIWCAIAPLNGQPNLANATPSQRAGTYVTAKAFMDWAEVDSADAAVNEIRDVCCVASLADLDKDPAARKRFEKMEREYLASKKEPT